MPRRRVLERARQQRYDGRAEGRDRPILQRIPARRFRPGKGSEGDIRHLRGSGHGVANPGPGSTEEGVETYLLGCFLTCVDRPLLVQNL